MLLETFLLSIPIKEAISCVVIVGFSFINAILRQKHKQEETITGLKTLLLLLQVACDG